MGPTLLKNIVSTLEAASSFSQNVEEILKGSWPRSCCGPPSRKLGPFEFFLVNIIPQEEKEQADFSCALLSYTE